MMIRVDHGEHHSLHEPSLRAPGDIELRYEVIVADPNFAPMYATRSRKVKTDKRDARTLAEAWKLGA